jgi:hypothetical protein
MKYTSRITQITVLPVGEPIFSESATVITIEDDAAGAYVRITQQHSSSKIVEQSIVIEPEEWEAVKDGVNQMLGEILRHEEETQ